MKLFIISLIFTVLSLTNQNGELDLKYYKGVQYLNHCIEVKKSFKIKKTKCDYFKISDQIINDSTYLTYFSEELNKREIQTYEKNCQSKTSTIRDTINELKKLSPTADSDVIVFFSEILDNVVFLEVLQDNSTFTDDYNKLTAINSGKIIMLVFDKDDNIIDSIIKEVNYN